MTSIRSARIVAVVTVVIFTVSTPAAERVTVCQNVPAAVFRKNISLFELFVSVSILPPRARSVNHTAALAVAVPTITRDSKTGLRLLSVLSCPIELRALA